MIQKAPCNVGGEVREQFEKIRNGLLENADAQTRESSKRFFKEEIKAHGVKSAMVAKIAKNAMRELKKASKREIFELGEKLWQSGYLEEGGVACLLSYSRVQEFTPEDLEIFENWLDKYVGNWASCDTLCNHSVGSLLGMYPELITRLKNWTASENRWKKRAAAVSLIIPARKGLFLPEILAISDALLADGDDLVQKGYGWMLKAASEAHPDKIFSYLMDKKDTMPRTAFRYALEKMPPQLRAKAMRK